MLPLLFCGLRLRMVGESELGWSVCYFGIEIRSAGSQQALENSRFVRFLPLGRGDAPGKSVSEPLAR